MRKKIMKIRAEKVIAKLQEMFGEGIEFACVDCHKTNQALTGITMKLSGCSQAPVVYMEDMPETASVEEIANIAAAAFQQAMRCFGDGQVPSLPNLSRDFILENVVLQAIGCKRNRQLLKEHPHILCLDLAGIFRIPIGEYEKNSLQSMMISNQIAEKFALSSDELTVSARRNTLDKFGVKFLHARETFGFFPGDQQKDIPFAEAVMDQPGLYVLTNDIEINGAALMLIPEILAQIGEKAEMDYYILPTSVHEIMVAKNCGLFSAKKLKSLVYEGNHTAGIVEPADILSDSVYLYCRQDKTLHFAK